MFSCVIGGMTDRTRRMGEAGVKADMESVWAASNGRRVIIGGRTANGFSALKLHLFNSFSTVVSVMLRIDFC